MHIWRISNFTDLSGRGGMLAPGRWHHAQTPIVYCTDHPASAMLEMLVHFDWTRSPRRFRLLTIELPDAINIASASIPPAWRQDIETTRSIGSAFILAAKDPVLAVPSVIVPHGINYLLSPSLVDAAGIHIVAAETHLFDDRLLDR